MSSATARRRPPCASWSWTTSSWRATSCASSSRSESDVEVVAQAANGVEALDGRWTTSEPDIVFLDVQMPGLTGFEVARRLLERGDDLPLVVFVTAFDQHAIEAFEVNAVDYLLKPVDAGPAGAGAGPGAPAAERRPQRATPAGLNDQLEQLVKMMAGRQTRRDQVAVKVGRAVLAGAGRGHHLSPPWPTSRLP